MDKRLKRWTQDLGVWSSIPAALVMCKSPGQSWIHTASVHPAVKGTRWNEKLVLCEWLQLQKIRCIQPGEMTVKEWVPILGGNWCKVQWAFGDIWTINDHLFPFTFIYYTVLYIVYFSKVTVYILIISRASKTNLNPEHVSQWYWQIFRLYLACSCLQNNRMKRYSVEYTRKLKAVSIHG